MLRQRKEGASASAAETSRPLDSDEQEKVLTTIAQEARRQTTFFTRVFSGFLLICGVALIRCSLHMLLGGDLEPLAHRTFLAEIPDAAFHATYAGQLLGLFLAYKVAQGEKWYILPGIMVLWTSLFSWLAVFRRFGVTNPLFYWMPLGPAVAWGLSLYLFCSGRALEKEVSELNGLRYNHKEL